MGINPNAPNALILMGDTFHLATCDGMVPPTINYGTPDPNCGPDYVPNKARPMKVRTPLSNSFGFGDQNDILAIRGFEE